MSHIVTYLTHQPLIDKRLMSSQCDNTTYKIADKFMLKRFILKAVIKLKYAFDLSSKLCLVWHLIRQIIDLIASVVLTENFEVDELIKVNEV